MLRLDSYVILFPESQNNVIQFDVTQSNWVRLRLVMSNSSEFIIFAQSNEASDNITREKTNAASLPC